MITTYRLLFVLLLILVNSLGASAQPKGEPIVIGETFSLHSNVLSEDRPYWIYLPDDYQTDTTPVTVMYLLDGDGHFHHTTGIVSFLADHGRIPRMMVVAIPNTTDRTRDLTPGIDVDLAGRVNMPTAGGANKMLQFIREELVPHIEKNYRVNKYRLLVGHSFGGIFAVNALLTQPDFFDAYIAISPSMWWDQQNLVAKAEAFLDKNPKLDTYFYMTMANEGGPMLEGAQKLAALFKKKAPSSFGWEFKLMEEEDHGSIPHRSTYYGLEAVFSDLYNADLLALYEKNGFKAIDAHYVKLSDKLGHPMQLTEMDINRLGYNFLGKDNYDKAIEVLRENVKRHPDSYNVYDSLAEAYMKKGDEPNAIKYYKKSLEIHPGNDNGLQMLRSLGVDHDPTKQVVRLSEQEMRAYKGSYDVANLGTLVIDVEDNQLVASIQSRLEKQVLKPFGNGRFLALPENFLIVFDQNDQQQVTGFTVQAGPGEYVHGRRK